MPTHALLGATGSTGGAVLRFLLDEPPQDLRLKIFVRNKAKLQSAFPELSKVLPFDIDIIEASTTDLKALKTCLADASVIYNCISTNESAPGVSVSRDIATSVVTALEELRTEQGAAYIPPTVIVNRSATLNHELRKSTSRMVVFVHFCLGDCYYDIDEGCKILERASAETHLLYYILADPPGLHKSTSRGRTGHRLILTGPQSSDLSYADLGAALVDLAQQKEKYTGKGVGISATGPVDTDYPQLLWYVSRGLRARLTRT